MQSPMQLPHILSKSKFGVTPHQKLLMLDTGKHSETSFPSKTKGNVQQAPLPFPPLVGTVHLLGVVAWTVVCG